MIITEMVRKAKEFAALAEKATPGPWVWDSGVGAPVLLGADETEWVLKEELVYDNGFGESIPSDEDMALIAAAPDMARLLAEMAEVLERLMSEWGNDWIAKRKQEETP